MRKRKKKPGQFLYEANNQPMLNENAKLNSGPPYLLEMNPDGTEINHTLQNDIILYWDTNLISTIHWYKYINILIKSSIHKLPFELISNVNNIASEIID